MFGILHKASSQNATSNNLTGVICCYPIFEERLHSHRIMVNFARYLADNGIHVLRFDYFGDGESEGLFEEASVTSRLSDICTSIDEIRGKVAGLNNLFLFGLRFGASLALLEGKKREDIKGIVAWEPIIKGKEYLYESLRVNLSWQMATHGKILHNREALIQSIEQGQTVNVEGYEIGNPFFNEASEIDISSYSEYRCPTFSVQISKRGKRPCVLRQLTATQKSTSIEYQTIEGTEFWLPQRRVYPSCEDLFSTTVNWIERTIRSART